MKSKWESRSLAEFLTPASQQVHLSDDADYKQVTISLHGRGVRLRKIAKGAEVRTKSQNLARGGQFIYSRIDARNGAMGIIPPELDGAIVTGDFPLFNINEKVVEPIFFLYLTRRKRFIEMCRNASRGVTNRKRLKEMQLLNLTVLLPSLNEQRRIVAQLGTINERIHEARRLQKAIEEEEGEFLSTIIQKVSEGAPRHRLGEIAPVVRRPVVIDTSESYPELGIRSFGKGTFHKPPLNGAEVGSKRLYRIEPGDLLFSNVFSWEGAIAVAQSHDSGRFGSHRFITAVPDPTRALPTFLCRYFLTEDGLAQIRGASPGAAGRNRTLGIQKLEAIEVPIPPLRMQEHFARVYERVLASRRIQNQIAQELDALTPSVLERAFNGEL
jgi:type I restriction enzyme S subunit